MLFIFFVARLIALFGIKAIFEATTADFRPLDTAFHEDARRTASLKES